MAETLSCRFMHCLASSCPKLLGGTRSLSCRSQGAEIQIDLHTSKVPRSGNSGETGIPALDKAWLLGGCPIGEYEVFSLTLVSGSAWRDVCVKCLDVSCVVVYCGLDRLGCCCQGFVPGKGTWD
jgi:hypothetical protein